jgi:negative regulator of flagellin synthesis FlgM
VKINGGGSVTPASPVPVQDVASGTQTGPQGPAAASARPDTVEISSLSAELAKLEKMLNDVGVVDIEHVEAIKLAISEGRFEVGSEVVADKLLQTVREYLLTQQKS